MRKVNATIRLTITVILLCWLRVTPVAEEAADGIEASYKFIAGSLQQYRRDGRLPVDFGLSQEQQVRLVSLMQVAYAGFRRGLEVDGRFCRFYLDPQNGRIELEERALLAMNYLPSVTARMEHYRATELGFQQQVREIFGAGLLEVIESRKHEVGSYEYLPVLELDGAESVHLADTFCGG